jgi:hypothetical protein
MRLFLRLNIDFHVTLILRIWGIEQRGWIRTQTNIMIVSFITLQNNRISFSIASQSPPLRVSMHLLLVIADDIKGGYAPFYSIPLYKSVALILLLKLIDSRCINNSLRANMKNLLSVFSCYQTIHFPGIDIKFNR